MRKSFILFSIITLAIFSANAQDFPANGNFENWTSATQPEGWTLQIEGTFEDVIPMVYPLGARTSDAHSGDYAVKLAPSQIPMSELTIPGVCQLGSSGTVNLSLEDIETLVNFTTSDFSNFDISMINTLIEFGEVLARGCPVDEVPSEVRAWIKFHPAIESSDRATFIAIAFNTLFSVRLPAAYGIYTIDEHIEDYQQIQFPIQKLTSTATCDSIVLLMMVSGMESSLQSELYIDDVTMLFDTWGIDESDSHVQVYPNPAQETLIINNKIPGNFDIQLFDISGRMVFRQSDVAEKIQINTSDFAPGNYVVKITQGNTINHRKVIIY